jgi:Uncharacterized protein conserved in bacteria
MSVKSLCAFAILLALCSALQGCSLLAADRGPLHPMTVMIPNAQGGGYDITARTMTNLMEKTGITGHIDVFNVVGDNETVAMARLMKERGNDDLMMMMGLGMVGASYGTGSAYRPSEATPLAVLTEQPEAVVVPANSPYTSISQLVAAWKADPARVRVGGGSSRGGPNYVFPMKLAQAVGIAPAAVRYTAYAGDGQMLPALLSHAITFGASGLPEYRDQIAAGQLRVLAISAAAAPKGSSLPTLKQAGIDLVYLNWHGVLAPPGISNDARSRLIDMLTRLHRTPQWRQALAANGWTDAFAAGDAFGRFLSQQERQEARDMRRLGLSPTP